MESTLLWIQTVPLEKYSLFSMLIWQNFSKTWNVRFIVLWLSVVLHVKSYFWFALHIIQEILKQGQNEFLLLIMLHILYL